MAEFDDRGFITKLDENEVFVFGSNANGYHGGGAAATAVAKFGAIWGQGQGLQGQSYAIDTMSGKEKMYTEIGSFIDFAEHHPDLTFYVTEIGCGIAGYKAPDVAPAFINAPENVILPDSFKH